MKRTKMFLMAALMAGLALSPVLAQSKGKSPEKQDLAQEEDLDMALFAKAGEKGENLEGPPPRGPMGDMRWLENKEIMERLKLSEEQLEKIHALRIKTEKEMIKNGALMSEKMIDLNELMDDEKLNEGKIRDLIKEISQIQSLLFTERMNTRLEVARLLTGEQRKELTNHLKFRGMRKHQKK